MESSQSVFQKVMRLPLLRLLTCGIAVLPITGGAEDAVSDPRGIYVVKIAGTQAGESQRRTYLGVQLLTDPRFMGLVDGVNGDAFSLQFGATIGDSGRPCYVHVLDGDGRGFISDIVEYRPNDLRCAADLEEWMEPFNQVAIRPHPYLSDIFGADNRFSLTSGLAAEFADNVVAWDSATQQERVYYYHSGRQRWEEKGINADAGSALLKFPSGIYIIRRSGGNLRMSLSGLVSGAPILLPVRPGVNVFSLPVNLSTSLANLIPATGDFPVIAGSNATQGDLITLEEPSSGLQKGPFYLSSRPDATGWREVGANASNEATQALDFLSTLVIRRNGPAGFVRVEGSLDPGPGFPLPADPEAGEVQLEGEFKMPPFSPPGISYLVEISTDLQNWSYLADAEEDNGVLKFPLPGGQGRAFYRLRVSLDF
jgi:hypothetical protein